MEFRAESRSLKRLLGRPFHRSEFDGEAIIPKPQRGDVIRLVEVFHSAQLRALLGPLTAFLLWQLAVRLQARARVAMARSAKIVQVRGSSEELAKPSGRDNRPSEASAFAPQIAMRAPRLYRLPVCA